MELGRECLELWGYKRVDELIWVKTNQLQRLIRTGRTGHWLNHSKEHCLVGYKGNPELNRGVDTDVVVAEVLQLRMCDTMHAERTMSWTGHVQNLICHACQLHRQANLGDKFCVLCSYNQARVSCKNGAVVTLTLAAPCQSLRVALHAGAGDITEAGRDVLAAGEAEPRHAEAGDLRAAAQREARLGQPGQPAEGQPAEGSGPACPLRSCVWTVER